MIEVYKIVHNYYDSKTAVMMNFNSFQTLEEITINCRNLFDIII